MRPCSAPIRRSAAAIGAALAAAAVRASDPGYYVATPYDDAGLITAEVRYWAVERDSRARQYWPEAGLRWGISSRWSTGVLVSGLGRGSGLDSRLSTLQWSNDWRLTQGEGPVDLALHTLWVDDRQDGRLGALEWGPMLQTEVDRTQLNLNLILERGRGAAASNPTRTRLQWQVRHHTRPGLHLGLQGFSELGPWTRFAPAARQSHRAGPALFWTLPDPAGGGDRLQLQAAWLFGHVYGQRGQVPTLRLASQF